MGAIADGKAWGGTGRQSRKVSRRGEMGMNLRGRQDDECCRRHGDRYDRRQGSDGVEREMIHGNIMKVEEGGSSRRLK
jgi:hypothetical protein